VITWVEVDVLRHTDQRPQLRSQFGDWVFVYDGTAVLGNRAFGIDDPIYRHAFQGHTADRTPAGVLSIDASDGERYHFAFREDAWSSAWVRLVPSYEPDHALPAEVPWRLRLRRMLCLYLKLIGACLQGFSEGPGGGRRQS
jgi:hypothetical protein